MSFNAWYEKNKGTFLTARRYMGEAEIKGIAQLCYNQGRKAGRQDAERAARNKAAEK